MARKSEADKVRPGIVEALDGAERHALPYLEAVAGEAFNALRLAKESAGGEVYPRPGPEPLKAALDAFDEAAKREELSDAMWSPRWVLSAALCAALSLALDKPEEARKLGASLRGWARSEDAKEAERDRDRTMLAYQEAFWALRRGEAPVKLSSGEGERLIEAELFAAHRAPGGVLIIGDSPIMASEWMARAAKHPDAYVRDLAHKVQRACSDAARGAR